MDNTVQLLPAVHEEAVEGNADNKDNYAVIPLADEDIKGKVGGYTDC